MHDVWACLSVEFGRTRRAIYHLILSGDQSKTTLPAIAGEVVLVKAVFKSTTLGTHGFAMFCAEHPWKEPPVYDFLVIQCHIFAHS